MLIIDDSNAHKFANVTPDGCGRGYVPRDWSKQPYGSVYGAVGYDGPIIPRTEWDARIDEMTEKKQSLADLGVPVKHQSSTNFCFPAGTLVRMGDGSHKPIEEVRVLDEVVTAEGRVKKVTQTMARYVEEPLFTPATWGHSHLKATGAHPVLTKRGYVAVKDLVAGDKIGFPKYLAESVLDIDASDFMYEKNHVKQARKQYRVYRRPNSTNTVSRGIPGRKKVTMHGNVEPSLIPLTYEIGRLVGLYLAEGHTTPYSVHWTFHKREEDTLALEVMATLEREFGCKPRIRTFQNTCQVTLGGKAWADLFDKLFFRGSKNKTLPAVMAAGSREFLKGVLTGWMDGDRQRLSNGVTVSRRMANDMFAIANAMNLMPLFSLHQRGKIGKDGIERADAWKVGWGDKGKPNHGTEQDSTHLWRKVREVRVDPSFKGYVFNLEVEDDHSYTAEGMGVHNCWWNAPIHCMEILNVANGGKYVELSAASGACRQNGFRNEGGWTATAIKRLVDVGVNTVEEWPNATINRKYDTAATRQSALKWRLTEWWELPNTRNRFDIMMTCLFLGFPVAIGLNWWGHEVTAIKPMRIERGRFGVLIDNSWGKDWGDNGRSVLDESKGTPDDAQAPRVPFAH